MKILVDADACPKTALATCLKLGRQVAVPVWTVASFNHNIASDHHIVVGDADQETDIRLINLTEPGDIVVTQDWGLAALVLGRGAACLGVNGRQYLAGQIDFLLEERAVKAKYRRGGGRTKGPAKRNQADDERFAATLAALLADRLKPS